MKNESEVQRRVEKKIAEIKTLAAERSLEYRERKRKLQDLWREKIFERDGWKCQICGQGSVLHLAHVTPVRAFLRAGRDLNAMERAYRDDNLITLCGTCHKSQHKEITSTFDERLKPLLDKRERMREDPLITEYLELNAQINELFKAARQDAQDRHRKVARLFYKLKRERGWKSAKALLETIERGEKITDFHPNSTKRERQRHREGVCEWHCRTCMGTTSLCECGRLLCEYHFRRHIKGERHF